MTGSKQRALHGILKAIRPVFLRKHFQKLAIGLIAGSLLFPNLTSAETINPNQVDGVYVFGDSLVDVGNLYQLSGQQLPLSPPYDQGRFSNGPLWVEDLLANLSFSLAPSTLGGTDFGYGGSTTNTFGVLLQVRRFVASFANVNRNTLYFVTAGANDFINDPTINPDIPVDNLVKAVSALFVYGARNVVVTNLPDLGKTPLINTNPESAAAYTATVIEFNRKLKRAMTELEIKRPGLNVILVDAFGLLNSIIANPTPYGITNVQNACVEGSYTAPTPPCANPDQYVFWDTVHPTRVTGQVFANFAYQSIFGSQP